MNKKIKSIYEGIIEKRRERGEITEEGYRILAKREGVTIEEAKKRFGGIRRCKDE